MFFFCLKLSVFKLNLYKCNNMVGNKYNKQLPNMYIVLSID